MNLKKKYRKEKKKEGRGGGGGMGETDTIFQKSVKINIYAAKCS